MYAQLAKEAVQCKSHRVLALRSIPFVAISWLGLALLGLADLPASHTRFIQVGSFVFVRKA